MLARRRGASTVAQRRRKLDQLLDIESATTPGTGSSLAIARGD